MNMPSNKVLPAKQGHLAIAIRKAIFTSAAVTAAAGFTPTTLAENAPAKETATVVAAAHNQTQENATEETVADLTKVSQAEEQASSESEDDAISITIGSNETLNAGDARVEGEEEHTKVYLNSGYSNHMMIDFYGENPKQFTSGNIYTGVQALDENGHKTGDVIEFTDGPVKIGELAEYMTNNENFSISEESLANVIERENRGSLGGQHTVEIIVAQAGDLTAIDAIGVDANTDAGDITIVNDGTIEVGSGHSIAYFNDLIQAEGNVEGARIDIDGDGVNDYMVVGEFNRVHSYSGIKVLDVYAKGIHASTNSGLIDVTNTGNVIAGNTASAFELNSVSGDVNITNSGDIEVGERSNGIVVNTAVQTEVLTTYDYLYDAGYSNVEQVGVAGEVSYVPEQNIHTYNRFDDVEIINADAGTNEVVVTNSGTISIGQASAGIFVQNPSGESAVVNNSGDINIAEGVGGFGIAVDMTSSVSYSRETLSETNVGDPNDPTKTEVCTLTQPVECEYVYSEFTKYTDIKVKDYIGDKGDVVIDNSGTIDLSNTLSGAGIYVKSDGAKSITNTGDILVGGVSIGISARGVGETEVINNSEITLTGVGAVAINVSTNPLASTSGLEQANVAVIDANKEAYAGLDTGNTNVINSGDITLTEEPLELMQYNENGALVAVPVQTIGMRVSSLNANLYNTATKFAQYGRTDVEGVEDVVLYETNVINDGNIILSDLSTGITASSFVGELNVTNNGYVKVGDGIHGNMPENYSARWQYSVGVAANNWSMEGAATQNVTNSESGIIVSGDLSHGLLANNWNGSNNIVNDGSITVGNGNTLEVDENRTVENTRKSTGIRSVVAGGFNAYNSVINNGSVETGHTSYGIVASNARTNSGLTDENFGHNYHVGVVNNGDVTTGDNSIGIYGAGYRISVVNNGDITISGGEFKRNGVDDLERSSAIRIGGFLPGGRSEIGFINNSGDIETGDTAIGIDNNAFFAISVQSQIAGIETGNNSIGINTNGFYQGYGVNVGTIITGDDSLGMNTFGAVSTSVNYGTLSTGNDSIGIKTGGILSQSNNQGVITAGENSTGILATAGSQTNFVSLSPRKVESEEDGKYGYAWYHATNADGSKKILVAEENGGLDINIDEGQTAYYTEKLVDDAGNAILTDEGREQYYLYYVVKDPVISVGRNGVASATNGGKITADVGIHVLGEPTENATITDFNGREFSYATQSVVSTVQNTGSITANTGILIEDVNQVVSVNKGMIEADTAIDVSVIAREAGLNSRLAFEEVKDEAGNTVYTTVQDANGNFVTTPMLQPIMEELKDANGFTLVGLDGEPVLVQAYEDVIQEAAVAVAVVANEGSITADTAIHVNVDNKNVVFAEGEHSTVNVYNLGTIDANQALLVTGDANVNVYNEGDLTGNVTTGDGDDFFYNRPDDALSRAGKITLTDQSIDLGGGQNEFRNTFGDIVFSGDSSILVGVDGVVNNYSQTINYATVSSVNEQAGDTLTIDGDVNFITNGTNTGLVVLETSTTTTDQIIIGGDLKVAEIYNQAGDMVDAKLNVALAPAAQFKGAQSHILLSDDEADKALITAKGEHNLDGIRFAGIKGNFADTVVKAEMVENSDGQQVIELVYGLSQMGTAASSVPHIVANAWQQNLEYAKDNIKQQGFEGFVNSFHTDSDVGLNGEIAEQDLSFAQRISGINAGIHYQQNDWGVSAFVNQSTSESSQKIQQASTSIDMDGVAITANYQAYGAYIDGGIQFTDFEGQIRNASSSATTKGSAIGASIEAGYQLDMFGFNWVPQLQISSVQVDVDGVQSGVYHYEFDNGANTQVRAGIKVNKTYTLSTGVVIPFVNLDYVDTQAENNLVSNDVSFLSDLTGAGYRIQTGVNSTYKAWAIDASAGFHDGDTNKNGLSIHFSVGYAW